MSRSEMEAELIKVSGLLTRWGPRRTFKSLDGYRALYKRKLELIAALWPGMGL